MENLAPFLNERRSEYAQGIYERKRSARVLGNK